EAERLVALPDAADQLLAPAVLRRQEVTEAAGRGGLCHRLSARRSGSAGPGITIERVGGAAGGAGAGGPLARESRRPPRHRPERAALVALAGQARIGVDGGDQRLAGLALGQEPRATARRRVEHHVAWPVLPRQPRGARAVGPAAGIAGACELRPV